MKYAFISLTLLCLFAISFEACKKDPEFPCSEGNNLCVKIDGAFYQGNATFSDAGSSLRLDWQNGTGPQLRTLQIELYGTSNGTYDFVNTMASGTALLKYNFSGIEYTGTVGSINISEVSATAISGTFSGTVTDTSGASRIIGEGNFAGVPKQ